MEGAEEKRSACSTSAVSETGREEVCAREPECVRGEGKARADGDKWFFDRGP